MVFSFNRQALHSVCAAALIVLATLKGGRTAEGTAFFLIVSALLFLLIFRQASLPQTALDPLIIAFLSITTISMLLMFPSGFRGMSLLSLLAAYAANFYVFLHLRDRQLNEKISITIVAVSMVLSAGIAAQFTSSEMKRVFFPNNNLLISFLNCGILAALYLWQKYYRSAQSGQKKKMLFNAAFGAILVFLLLAELRVYSIGGAIALAAGVAVFAGLNKIKAPQIYLAALAAALAAVLIFPHLTAGFILKAGIVMENYRFQIWQTGWHAFWDKPLFGWGPGNFEAAYQIHKLPIDRLIGRYGQTTSFAHNGFIQIAVELGIVGLAVSLLLLAAISREVRAVYRTGTAHDEHHWALSCIVMLLVHGFFDFNLHLPILGLLLMFFCAQFVRSHDPKGRSHRIPIILSSLMIAMFSSYFGASAYKYMLTRNAANGRLSDKKGGNMLALVRIDPMNHQVYGDMARYLFLEKRFDESLIAYSEAIKRSPKDPFYLAEAGDIFVINRRIDLARPYYMNAVQLEPLYAFGHYRLGEIELALKNMPAARNAFTNALRIAGSKLAPGTDYERRLLELDARMPAARLEGMPR